MIDVRKDEGVMVDDGYYFAFTSLDSPCPYAYAEFINGVWSAPRDSCDTWNAKVISWDEFTKRTSTRVSN